VRLLDGIAEKVLPPEKRPSHQKTGRAGEEVASFHLRELGYVMVARNYRSWRRRCEVDLIRWDDDVLCFVEVKTRTTRDVKPAEAAVDDESATNWPAWRVSTCGTCPKCGSGVLM